MAAGVRNDAGVAHQGIEARHAVVGEPRPHREVEAGVVLGVSGPREAVERVRVDVEVVQLGQRVDKRHHGLGTLGPVDRRQVAAAGHAAPSAARRHPERRPLRVAPGPRCARAPGTPPPLSRVRSRCRRTSRRPRTGVRVGGRRRRRGRRRRNRAHATRPPRGGSSTPGDRRRSPRPKRAACRPCSSTRRAVDHAPAVHRSPLLLVARRMPADHGVHVVFMPSGAVSL